MTPTGAEHAATRRGGRRAQRVESRTLRTKGQPLSTRDIRVSGPGARGTRVDAGLLRDLLGVLVDGCQQAVRLRVEGRSTAQGTRPAWVERAGSFDVVAVRQGSTLLVVEAPPLEEALPEQFAQADLFSVIEPGRSCLDLFEESARDAIEGRADSEVYDDGLIRTLEEFSRVLRHDVDAVEFSGGTALRIDPSGVEALRRLRRAIPPDQRVRLAGKLDVLRHTDRMFTLLLPCGTRALGVVASAETDLAGLAALRGHDAVVTGIAKFRPSGSLLRIEAERIEPADQRDLELWGSLPRSISSDLNERALRQPQGPRSGVSAIFGQLADAGESDEDIVEALDRFS